jgi:hypothetical protein
MGPSLSTLLIMAPGLCKTVESTGLRYYLFIHRRFLSLGVYFLFSRTHALSYKRIIITTSLCSFSSILDRTRVS